MVNVVKTTFRNFLQKPITNLINLLGLSISLALVVMLSVFSYSELTTDHFHANGNRVYLYGQIHKGINSPGVLKELIELNIPGVESAVRISGTWGPSILKIENMNPFLQILFLPMMDSSTYLLIKLLQVILILH